MSADIVRSISGGSLASEVNSQILMFCSRIQAEQALGTDAFLLNWIGMTHWAFPPPETHNSEGSHSVAHQADLTAPVYHPSMVRGFHRFFSSEAQGSFTHPKPLIQWVAWPLCSRLQYQCISLAVANMILVSRQDYTNI